MTDTQKLVAGILAGITAIITAIAIYFGLQSPLDPPPVELILDSIEKVEYADEADWKTEVRRYAFRDSTIGVMLRTADACGLASMKDAYAVYPIPTKYPSAKEYEVGEYLDGLRPLTEDYCDKHLPKETNGQKKANEKETHEEQRDQISAVS